MNNIGQQASRMLRFAGIHSFELPIGGEVIYPAFDSQAVVLGLSGRGTLASVEEIRAFGEGTAYFLGPGSSLRLFAGDEPLIGRLICFEAYEYSDEQDLQRMDSFIVGARHSRHFKQLAALAESLLQWQEEGTAQFYVAQAELYKLMSLLIEESSMPQENETTAAAIARVSKFMDQHPELELTRQELARLAGFSPGYFTRMFQQYTGQTPTAYLMDLRMGRAKQMLLSGSGVKETASRLGFEDEFYFSRRFKLKTGSSPAAFVQSRRRSIASISDPLSGSLLALHILPKAAAFYPHHELYRRMIRLHSYEYGEGPIWEKNLEMLQTAAPGLIFCTDTLPAEAKDQLKQIADTVAIPWLSADWREHLRMIAEVMEQSAEAGQWLAEYDHKAAEAGRQLRNSIGGATINILRVTNTEYRIYGRRNAGAVIYNDFGLQATHQLDQIQVFQPVAREELPSYDADILLIMVDSTQQAARQWKELQTSRKWNQLTAVRYSRVHVIGTEKLFEYSAWSHDRAVSYLGKVLSNQKSR